MLRGKNVNIKALALLYLRMYCHPEDLFGWVGGKLEDDDLINAEMTVGEFVRRLLDEDRLNYEGIRLPRLPVRVQKGIDAKLGKDVVNADENRIRAR